MEFYITFKAKDAILYGFSDEYGTDFLDSIIKDYNLKNVDYSDFEVDLVCPYVNKCELTISSREIKNIDISKLDIFRSRHIVNVQVEDGSLGKYLDVELIPFNNIYRKFWIFKTFKNKYKIRFIINKEKLIKEWINVGCPLEQGNVKCDYYRYICPKGDIVTNNMTHAISKIISYKVRFFDLHGFSIIDYIHDCDYIFKFDDSVIKSIISKILKYKKITNIKFKLYKDLIYNLMIKDTIPDYVIIDYNKFNDNNKDNDVN